MKGEDFILLFFGALFLFSIIMIMGQGMRSTGYATEVTTTSNVTISVYFAIALSANLTNGIEFGTVTTLPTTNQNATDNYNGVNTTAQGTYLNGTNGTSLWTNVSTDSNTAVDFCNKADALNTTGGDVIGLGNETYYNNTNTNYSIPAPASEVSITTSYVKSGYNITAGSINYYRFWLDVPAGTATGTYDNVVSFKGVAKDGVC